MPAGVAALHAAVRPQQMQQRHISQLWHVDVQQRQTVSDVSPRHGGAISLAAILLLRVPFKDGLQRDAGMSLAKLLSSLLPGWENEDVMYAQAKI